MPSCHSRVGSRPALRDGQPTLPTPRTLRAPSPAAHIARGCGNPLRVPISEKIIPAATYSPTEFPLQYHRPWRT